MSNIIPDEFKTKPNLDRKSSEVNPADLVNGQSEKSKGSNSSSKKKESPLKDRDWRGEQGGEFWWETIWEGMDGIGGTNRKGKRCFDKVRIWWRDSDA